MMIDAITTTAPTVQAGQVRALGTTGMKRSAVLPDVPTIAEAGVPGYEATIWLGIMAPAGTPKPIVDKLNAEINKVLQAAEVKEAWAKQGAEPLIMTPAEFDNVPARRHREVGQGHPDRRHQGAVSGRHARADQPARQWRRAHRRGRSGDAAARRAARRRWG